MFMRIVLQLSGKVTALYTQVLAWPKAQLLKLASNLRVRFIQAYLSVIDLLHHLSLRVHTVLLQSNDKLVALIKMVRSLISENKIAKTPMVRQWTQVGLKYLGLASQTIQPASPPVNPKQNLVERTKSGKFARKGTGVVLTPMVRQRQADGKFSKIVASQPQQPAMQASKKEL